MIHGKNSMVCIITARGGSKRIPRKNIKPFLGKPIIQYSIEAALQSECFNEVMVSTDDMEIASISESLGAKIPFLRSPKNSDDYSTTADVLEEVINEYKKRGVEYSHLCCIYPTAPFVTAKKLRQGFDLLIEKNADSVVPVTRFSYPIQRSLKIDNGLVKMNWPENYNARSQDLLPVYHDVGQFYFLSTRALFEQKKLYTEVCYPIVVPESEVQDIDNEEDWKIAELKYKMLQNGHYA